MNAHGEMFIGKPDAGNLLVRFEEGEGNPSLLYTKSANEERLRLHWITLRAGSPSLICSALQRSPGPSCVFAPSSSSISSRY